MHPIRAVAGVFALVACLVLVGVQPVSAESIPVPVPTDSGPSLAPTPDPTPAPQPTPAPSPGDPAPTPDPTGPTGPVTPEPTGPGTSTPVTAPIPDPAPPGELTPAPVGYPQDGSTDGLDDVTVPPGTFSSEDDVTWNANVLAGVNQYSPPVWWPLRATATIWCTYLSEGRCGDYHPYWALDIGAPLGTPIYAAGAGKVTVFAGSSACGGAGQGVVIDHGNGISSMYWHMSVIAATQGQWVDQNTIIGYVGTSGNVDPCGAYHLHYEKRLNGNEIDPGPLKACFGSALTTYPQQNGQNSWQGYPADVTRAHSDGTGCQTPTAEGNFVSYLGDIYRIVGGAPVVISSWDPFGGVQETIPLTEAQWKTLRSYPADGTRIRAMPGGRNYVMAGGAPIYITTYDNLPPAPTIDVDTFAIEHPNASVPLSHIRATPADVFLLGYTSQRPYRVTVGHPYFVSSWAPYGSAQPTVLVDQASIDSCDHLDCSPWGAFDSVTGGAGSVVVSGWAMDAESTDPATIRVTVDGVAVADSVADGSRPDVDAYYARGPDYGFVRIAKASAGSHSVCVTALNTGHGANASLGCKTVGATTATFQPAVDRVSDDDRYSGAVATSRSGFPGKANVVYVATGENYPDALSAAPAAIKQGGPILLTPSAALPTVVRDEIVRLHPGTIVVVGGEDTVSAGVFAQLTPLAATIVRLAGADRFQTSAAIANYAFPTATRAFVATGTNFPDALSAGSAAGTVSAPILLINGSASSLDPLAVSTLKNWGVTKVTLVGGPDSVSAPIATQLAGIATTVRLGGADRYLTSQAINADVFKRETRAFIATGENFPDALAGAAIAGKLTSPLFVVPSGCVPKTTLSAMSALGVTRVTLLGGSDVLDENVEGLMPCS
jgi:putative cell wall-binding protein